MSDPDPLRHNSSAYDIDVENIKHESEIGPELIHIYQVENKGPSDIVEAKVFILWPSFRPNGDPLLYLTSQPIIEGLANCDIVENVNPFQVEVDRYHHIRSSSSSGSRPDFFEDYVNDEENSLIEEVNFEKTSKTKLRRPKRDANVQMKMEYQEFQSNSELVLSPSPRDQKLIDQLDCGPTKCTHMACTVGPLRKRESVVFRIYSRLWSSTISRLSHHQYEISSRLVSVVTKLPHNVDPSFLDIKSKTGMFYMNLRLKCTDLQNLIFEKKNLQMLIQRNSLQYFNFKNRLQTGHRSLVDYLAQLKWKTQQIWLEYFS